MCESAHRTCECICALFVPSKSKCSTVSSVCGTPIKYYWRLNIYKSRNRLMMPLPPPSFGVCINVCECALRYRYHCQSSGLKFPGFWTWLLAVCCYGRAKINQSNGAYTYNSSRIGQDEEVPLPQCRFTKTSQKLIDLVAISIYIRL